MSGNTGTHSGASAGAASGARPWTAAYPQGLDWDMAIDAMPLFCLLDDAVGRCPDHRAVDFLGKTWTYREIGVQVAKAALGLQQLGVSKGVKVGLLLPNCPYYPVCFFAILKAGGTVVNYNPLDAEQQLLNQIDDSETDILMTLDVNPLHRMGRNLLRRSRLRRLVICSMVEILPFPRNILFRLFGQQSGARGEADAAWLSFNTLIANDGSYRETPCDPQVDFAAIQYTGGTTGTPKGALLTHANLHANALQISRWFTDAEPGRERVFAVLPLFHAFGMTAIMNLAIALGAELVMLPRFNVRSVLRSIERTKPTLFLGVPTIFRAIADYPRVQRYDLRSLKVCVSGGDTLPPDVQRRFETTTGCSLTEGYGLTECSPVVTCNPFTGTRKRGSVGLPLPRTTVTVVSLTDRRTPLPLGSYGEICVSGPQVMTGYWKRQGATMEVLADGLLHTGDIGYIDQDGYLYVVDRLKDMIITGGSNVYPRAVEEAIRRHPGVADVAVVGASDAYWGQIVKAHIVKAPDAKLTEAEIRHFLKDKLSRFEIPRRIEFCGRLPLSPIGKVLKRKLRDEEDQR